MAHMLHLPKPDTADDGITREIKVRTWWSLYMVDRWSSAGLNLPREIQYDGQNVLPMPESDFWRLETGQRAEVGAHPGNGLWGYMVILARIFSHIQDLHQSFASGELDNHQAEATTQDLAQKLEDFCQELSPNAKFSIENLQQHAAMGLGQAFVALHFGYHHYATLLYFQYLDTQLARTTRRTKFATRCKYHAAAFSDLLRLSQEHEGCEGVYPIVAHMTVVSSSALLHTLLFGHQDELLEAKWRLCFNFEVLLKLRSYWPGVELMVRSSRFGILVWPMTDITKDGSVIYFSKSLHAFNGENLHRGPMERQISSSSRTSN